MLAKLVAFRVYQNTAKAIKNSHPALNRFVQKFYGQDAGDAAYLSRHNCDLVAALGGVARFYPKKGTTLRQKGSVAWCKMLEELTADPQKWLEDYHKRSNVEGSFSILKRDSPFALRKKLDERREQEAFGRTCTLIT